MELRLIRTLLRADGVNGTLWYNKLIICYTIELPWNNNKRGISCIPAGRYRLQDRFSPVHGDHIEVLNVPNRSNILFHPANDALRELRGCIAPVSALLGPGRGEESRIAFGLLKYLVYRSIRERDKVWLTIEQ